MLVWVFTTKYVLVVQIGLLASMKMTYENEMYDSLRVCIQSDTHYLV